MLTLGLQKGNKFFFTVNQAKKFAVPIISYFIIIVIII